MLSILTFALAPVAIASSRVQPAAEPVVVPTTAPLQLAQLAGQCRQLKPGESAQVYSDRGTTSARVLLQPGREVTLDEATVVSGFIRIRQPLTGYVEARPLTTCGGQPPIPPTGDRCRLVVRPNEGLVIRDRPSSMGDRVGSVARNQRVTLTTLPPTTQQEGSRTWVGIQAPANGWVSNGTTGSPSNLVYCP